jgi:REP element-mobilizing transposase RayT
MERRPTVYHLIFRFVGGEFFIEGDHERDTYVRLLGEALRNCDWKCIAYAVMSNHIHLGMVAGLTPRSEWLREVHSPFGAWINKRKERIGSVFTKIPKTRAVHRDEVAAVVAYIHNNPVRAAVVAKARESSWTSHNAYLGTAEPPDWLHIEMGRALMRIEGSSTFDEFVNSEARRPRNAPPKRGRPRRKPIAMR